MTYEQLVKLAESIHDNWLASSFLHKWLNILLREIDWCMFSFFSPLMISIVSYSLVFEWTIGDPSHSDLIFQASFSSHGGSLMVKPDNHVDGRSLTVLTCIKDGLEWNWGHIMAHISLNRIDNDMGCRSECILLLLLASYCRDTYGINARLRTSQSCDHLFFLHLICTLRCFHVSNFYCSKCLLL